MRTKNPNYATIQFDESGNTVMFGLPHAALYMDTGLVPCNAEAAIQCKTMDKLIGMHYKEVDRSDVLIHDLEDKVTLVAMLRKNGRWIK